MEIARYWRLQEQRYNLIGECCPHCEKKIFPPRDICPGCGGKTKDQFRFSGKGEVYSYTTVYDAPAGFDKQGPYPVALVRLDEGPLVAAQLTDLPTRTVKRIIDGEEREVTESIVNIGDRVEMVTRRLKVEGDEDRGQIIYGYKFRPDLKQRK